LASGTLASERPGLRITAPAPNPAPLAGSRRTSSSALGDGP